MSAVRLSLLRENEEVSRSQPTLSRLLCNAPSGDKRGTYSVNVNGPWCITFEWADEGATHVDLEQYH